MSNAKFVNIARLITAYNLEIDNEMLLENLKCAKCKLVLKDACAGPCGCRFCRVCIDDLMASDSEFCLGVAEDCGVSLLSDFATDYGANKSVSKLVVKCPQNGCLHQCQLDELEEHMRVCGRKSVACPFHELGCQQDKLAAEEMSRHFQHENQSHSQILIGMVADIKSEMESHKREIEMLKSSNESSKTEIDMLKQELVLKTGQIRTIINQLEHMENENKLLKNEIKSIKGEKVDLCDRVRILSEKIDREIDEIRESDEQDIVNVIEHVDSEIAATTAVIGSNKDELDTAIKSVKDDIQSINYNSIKSINNDIDRIKSQIKSMQALTGLGQIDASCEWTIDIDVGETLWSPTESTSGYFIGVVHPYKYRLESWNIRGVGLCIHLYIHCGASDAQLPWPFLGKVAITVADKSRREACQKIIQQCNIGRPPYNHYSNSRPFKFSHSSLTQAGVDLARGVRVSCVIVLSCEV